MHAGNMVFNYGVKKDAVSGVQGVDFRIHLKLQYPFQHKDQLLSLMAVDLVVQILRAYGYQNRLHLLAGHLDCQWKDGVAAFRGDRRPPVLCGGNKNAIPAVSLGNKSRDIGMQGGCNLDQCCHRGDYLAAFDLGKQALGKAAIVGHILQRAVLKLSELSNVSADILRIRNCLFVLQSVFLLRVCRNG